MAAIDLDRGVMQRFHPSGMKITMYVGNAKGEGAEYGVYYTETGQVLDPKFAADAGFDVERHKREAFKQAKMAEYKAQLDRESATEEDALAQAVSNNGNVDVRHVGGGQFAIFDKKGAKLTRVAMTRADLEMMGVMVPTSELTPANVPDARVGSQLA